MSEVVYFSFRARHRDIRKWENVFRVLDADHQGVKFQLAMEVFGELVVAKLNEILESEDYVGADSFVFEGWCREDNEFRFEIDLPFELVDEFTEVFRLCPIDSLEVDVAE